MSRNGRPTDGNPDGGRRPRGRRLDDRGLARRRSALPDQPGLRRRRGPGFPFPAGQVSPRPRPDLILLDLQLPKVDGREVLTKVRADERLKRIPVVVLTSSLTHLKILQSENLRVESYLNKPIDLAEFSRVVKSLRKYMLADVLLPQ